MDADLFVDVDDGRALAQAIVDTIREPLLVLDKHLRVIAASRSFYEKFQLNRQLVQGLPIYALGNGQWNIPELRLLLENILPKHTTLEAYEVEHEFAGIGRRAMLLNARAVFTESKTQTLILLAIEDITVRRASEREVAELLRHKEMLLQEMQHRIANSLQIIASILLLKARTVRSEETRLHLQDAQQRIMSVAAVQRHLHPTPHGEQIDLAPYLHRLCESLAGSMIGDSRPIELTVTADDAAASSSDAISIGLIVTELVINSLKHAFADDADGGLISVTYERAETSWRLTVSDNGMGSPGGQVVEEIPGLGTGIVGALARQLGAQVEIVTAPQGRSVSIARGPFPAPSPAASHLAIAGGAACELKRNSRASALARDDESRA
jgi:two-component sensor histidine kinase